MSPVRFQLLAVAAALMIAAPAGARPGGRRSARSAVKTVAQLFSLERKTLCPFEVKFNEDPARRPAVIKEIECAKPWPVPELGAMYSCVQLEDNVPVHYGEARSELTVNVGCVCVKNHHREAASAGAPVIV